MRSLEKTSSVAIGTPHLAAVSIRPVISTCGSKRSSVYQGPSCTRELLHMQLVGGQADPRARRGALGRISFNLDGQRGSLSDCVLGVISH